MRDSNGIFMAINWKIKRNQWIPKDIQLIKTELIKHMDVSIRIKAIESVIKIFPQRHIRPRWLY